MTTSQKAIDQIKIFEGYKDKAYLDIVGKPTIGYGHTLNVTLGMTCTPEVAEEWLRLDIIPCETSIVLLTHSVLTQGQFDALVSFSYNLGVGNLAKSTLIILIRKGDMEAASREFIKWNHAGGKVLPGLTLRREWERKRFLGLI
jgi:lysozyme